MLSLDGGGWRQPEGGLPPIDWGPAEVWSSVSSVGWKTAQHSSVLERRVREKNSFCPLTTCYTAFSFRFPSRRILAFTRVLFSNEGFTRVPPIRVGVGGGASKRIMLRSQNVINNFGALFVWVCLHQRFLVVVFFFSFFFFKVPHRCVLKGRTFVIGRDHTPWQLVHLPLKMTDGKTQTQKEGATIK